MNLMMLFYLLAKQIDQLKKQIKYEFLIPDFKFKDTSIRRVISARPYVMAHNLESVKRLFNSVRPQGDYNKSLKLLESLSDEKLLTKTALIVGFGETFKEIFNFLQDVKEAGISILTIGQYLPPGKHHLKPAKIYTNEEWQEIKDMVNDFNFYHAEIGPFVRSSYMAHRVVKAKSPAAPMLNV